MTESKRYVDASDEATEYATAQVDAMKQDALEDIDDLFTKTAGRDTELWEEIGVDPDATTKDFDAVQRDDRDLDWSLGLAGLSTAATIQFFVTNRNELILKPVAYREQMLDGLDLALTGASLAAYAGRTAEIGKFAKLQAKYLDDLAPLKKLSNKDLYLLLRQYDAIAPTDQMISAQVGYVARMTGLRPGSPQFTTEVAKLINVQSTRTIKGMNRRAVEYIYNEREIGSDHQKKMAWLIEGGLSTCEFCIANNGKVKTYAQWIADGRPGAEVCAGGDLCRCHLAAV